MSAKISALASGAPAQGSDAIAIARGAAPPNLRLSVDDLKSYIGAAAVGKNYLANGAMQVAQRKAAGLSAALTNAVSYLSIDRWWAYQLTTAAGIFDRVTAGVPTGFQYAAKLGRTNGNAGTTKIACGQAMESVDAILLAGQTVTLSFQAKAGANFSAASSFLVSTIDTGTGTDQSSASQEAATWTGQVATTQNNTLTTSWQTFKQTLAIPSGATQIGIRLSYTPAGTAGADDNAYITAVKLEVGSANTAYLPRSYQEELALAQRWLPFWISDSTTYFLGNGHCSATTNGALNISFPVQARAKPTGLTISGATDITVNAAAGAFASTAVALGGVKGTLGANVNATIAGATAGQGATFYMTNASGYLFFTGAEL